MNESTTDPELTVLAAKAAGIRFEAGSEKPNPKSGAWWGLWLIYDHEPDEHARRYWRPLTDDGDALRLAVKLDIQILRNTDGTVSGVTPTTGFWERIKEPLAPDAYAATRRAITRCAAEIGRSHHG